MCDDEKTLLNPKKVSQILDDVCSEICDNYCKWHDLIDSEDELFKRCDECPLVKYL